ncbi:restriction endonuclease subunit S [Bacteroides uniformis]|uniref:restriction endonuclease subunit S n=1 Tax=Bacteroides uniformis TaxID=820 RepID=UPI001C37E210|nr:restriction endonuclease subunit S [Bacteroides uniformis]MBV3829565.1 restriction endonuclease subunit S [Bacteroides uniformis]
MTNNNDKKVLNVPPSTDKGNAIRNVPPLRFPEFSGEWKEEQLDSIATLSKGVGISKEQLSEVGEPCILYGELYTKYKSEIIKQIESKTDIDCSKLKRSKANDVIIPCSGETAVDIATARCVPFDNILFGGDLNVISLHKYDGAFMSYQLNGKRKYDIARVAQGVSVVHLYGDHLKAIKTYNPTLPEQQKIAKLLSLLDERIATQNKIIEKYESLIKGINCKIFALIQGNEYRLGDIATITNGNSNVQDASVEYRVGLYPFFDRSEDVKYLPTFLFDKESIIYPGEGTEFMPRYYNGKFALHQRCYAICDFNEAVNPQFLYFFLKTQNSYFIRNAVGSTVPSLRLDTFQKLKVVIPSKETQYSVYSFLSTLEQKLDVENSIMKMLLCQKRYLLRQMFI